MPIVPSVDAPQQSQSGAPIGVSAPADAFSGNVIAGALDKTGAALGQQSDMLEKHAEQYQMLNNKVEADKGFQANINQLDQLSTDFRAHNQGIKASQNLGDFIATAEKQRADIGAGMSNPMAASMYDADSRRALQNVTSQLTNFAAAQRQEDIEKTYIATQNAVVGQGLNNPGSFDSVVVPQIMQNAAAYAESHGFSEEVAKDFGRKTLGQAVVDMTKMMSGSGNITGASAFLEAHKDGMDPKEYANQVMQLKPGLIANDAASIGHSAVQDAMHGLNSSVGPTVDYVSNVHGREGDTKNPASTANGIGQFTEGTWMKTMQSDPQFAQDIAGKTPAQIQAMRHDPGVANRAIISYAQSNASELGSKGYTVNAATVGLAHGYGPGGAEQILSALDADPTKKIDDIIGHQVAVNNRVSGQTVQQVVGAFTQRFGTGSTDGNNMGTPTSYQLAARQDTVLALVHAGVQAKYGDNAQIEDMARGKALSELQAQVGAARNNETEAYTTLSTFAKDNQIQDLPTLLASAQNGLQLYNSLPRSQQKMLENDTHRNATELTPTRMANITILDGMWGSRTANPEAILNADVAHMDLTQSARLQWMKQIADFRGKAQTSDPQSKALIQITQTPEYKSLISPSALNIRTGSEEEYTLRGNIAGQLEDWYAQHPAQAPAQKDIQAMIARAAGQHSFHTDYLGGLFRGKSFTEQAVPDISQDDKDGISRQLTKLGIPVTPFTISKFYEQHADKGTK